MPKLFYFSMALVLAGCVENSKAPIYNDTDTVAITKNVTTSKQKALPEKVIAERLSGTVTLLDTINGRRIATLHDNVLLNAGIPKGNWVMVGIETEITPVQDKSLMLKKGQKLLIKGKPVGETLEDIQLELTGQNKEGARTGLFYGYMPAGKIKAGSIIETALSEYLRQHPGRTLPDMQSFIKQFQLQATGFNEPFLEYANYESTVDNPSPAYRTVLIFYKNKLIGVAGSRHTKLQGTTEHKLDRGFHGYFFADTDSKLQQEYIRMFNNFINSVD
ncbi:hypothetical protein SAMN05428988_5578 [Chitinophaga sp. YR573]|uniref:hypothetical protein n=1 Tax=Chitinophaga sp. YR573 TaxID=1881040 RepID=UPI0008ADB418|nr:hypothetical protein [Chitinophaga sp. YR573]SEW43552.1 hypothetical protein SAMN05428988_5578 [Chitinophaga sp. YR573]